MRIHFNLVIKKVIFSFIAIFLVAGAIAGAALAEDSTIKIGVLTKRGPERYMEEWSPTAEYLTENIPGKTFTIVPIAYDQIYTVVKNGEVDFILANPSFYVELENYYGISRIATLKAVNGYDLGKITLPDVLKKYWIIISLNFATLVALAWFLGARIKLSRKLKTAHVELQSEVDERRQAGEALRESKKRYERHFNSVTESVLIFDGRTGIFVNSNKAASRLYGYTNQEFLQLHNKNIIAEHGIPKSPIKKVITDGKINIPVRYHKKKDGTVFPVEITPGSFKIKNKAMVFGVTRDITERIRNEENVQKAENRLRFLTRRLIDTREDECKRISLEL
ncbi:MAG: PAS domain S-box protein, partial [Proteobacteria bacterium]|nr:PAS domain S-box protein [Pseudomonadota bacterium]